MYFYQLRILKDALNNSIGWWMKVDDISAPYCYTYTQPITAFISVGSRVFMNDLSLTPETREEKQKEYVWGTNTLHIAYINLINKVRVYGTILNNNFNIKDWWQENIKGWWYYQ